MNRRARLHELAWEVRFRYCPNVCCLDASELLRLLGSGGGRDHIWVDCRTEPERQVSKIAVMGCPTLTKEEFSQRAAELMTDSTVVVTYCTVGGRSGRFCETVIGNPASVGLWRVAANQMTNVLGGIAAWLHSGGGLVTPQGIPTRRVHAWCQAFMDVFPVEGLELICDEHQTIPQDAKAFADCCCGGVGDPTTMVPLKILGTCQALKPDILDDTLTRAANSCAAYED